MGAGFVAQIFINCDRQNFCFERATTFSLPPQKRRKRWGEEALLIKFPTLRLSSPLVPRGEREPIGRKRSACRTQQMENRCHASGFPMTYPNPPTVYQCLGPTRDPFLASVSKFR